MIRPLIRLSFWLLPIILLAHTAARAQTHLIYLTPNPQRHVHRFLYNKVTVLDNRMDTLGITLSGKGERIKFARPASESIAAYIRSSTRLYIKGDGNLLLNIKRLQCTVEMEGDVLQTYMIFAADAYSKRDDGTYDLLSRMQFQTKFKEAFTTAAVTYLLDRAISKVAHAKPNYDESFYLPCINQPVNADWAAYPIINKAVAPVAGLYTEFSAFRDNVIIPYAVRMKPLADGSYQMNLPISFNTNADKKARNCWAVADSNGLLYIHLEHNIFLPLERRDNTFCFRVPQRLSDMHMVPLLSKQGPPPPLESPPSYGTSSFGDVFGNNNAATLYFLGAVVVAAITIEIATNATTRARAKNRDQHLKIYTPSREAIIEMDTGAITYY